MDHILDVADLPAPEPLERTLDALSGLPSGDRLLLRLHRQPFPLFDLLRTLGYRWEVSGREGNWQVCIEPETGGPSRR